MTRRVATVRRRSISFKDAQFSRAIAASAVGPRTVLNAGHSNTAVSVYNAAYACASWLRYAWTIRAFNESMPAVASPADGRDGCAQARHEMPRDKVAALIDG